MSRERDPFVFTQEMAFIVGGRPLLCFPLETMFRRTTEIHGDCLLQEIQGIVWKGSHSLDPLVPYVSLCQAFNSLRQQSSMIETLFTLMVSAGMPELLKAEDVEFARTQLDLDLSDKEVSCTCMNFVLLVCRLQMCL